MIGLILYLTGLLVACGCGIMGAWSDWKGMTIPNIYPAIIIGAFGLSFVGTLLGQPSDVFGTAPSHLLSGGIMFISSFALYVAIKFGAGDSKLITAYGLWLTPPLLIPFLFAMSVIGASLSLLAIIIKRTKPFKAPAEGSWIAKLQDGQNVVPYGIAITGGAIIAFIAHGYVDPANLECFLKTGCS